MLLTDFDRSTVLTVFLGLTASSIIYFAIALIKHRRFYNHLPKPPHTFLLGSLVELGRVTQSLPANAHPQNAITLLHRQHKLPGIFYIDTWPVAVPMLIITEPSVAAQVTQKPSLPRHSLIKGVLRNLTGPRSIFDTNGQEWKSLRSLFNPGFASTHLNTLVPGIADHVMVFHEKLLTHARKGDVFPVENMVTSLTLDIIGQVVLGQNLDSQNGNSPIADTFRKGVNTQWNHMDLIGKMKGIPMLWWYCRRLDKLIGEAVKDRYQKRQFEKKIAVIDLALQAYNEEKSNRGDTKTKTDQIDPEFLKVAVDNVKTFILGGHDTTASTIAYCYYNLWKHQDILQDLRTEHDSVFDVDSAKTLDILKQDPRKIGALPLTTAVIKETLRLFPPGSSFRESAKGATVTYHGSEYPIYGHAIWVIQHTMNRRPDLFPSPDSFLPARFHESSPSPAPSAFPPIPRDAFRPFEKGPRNCIGQELAMMEMKIILLLTIRDFNLDACYDEEVTGQREGRYAHIKGQSAPEELGGRAYQMLKFSPKPNEGMPLRVTVRNQRA